jgi:hypothetical protein
MDSVSFVGMVRLLSPSVPDQMLHPGVGSRPMARGVYPLAGFAPEDQLKKKIINQLTARGLIKVARYPSTNAIVIADKSFNGKYLDPVYWELNIHDPMGLINDIEQVAQKNSSWPTSWWAQFRDVWYEIAFSECLEFYIYQSEIRNLLIPSRSAVELMLQNLLKVFSVSQCYQIIYSGAQQTADFIILNESNRHQASNYMIGACQRRGERARAEGWVLKGFYRDFNLPQSSISRVYFDQFLRIGERGFTQCPFSAQQIDITCA